MTKHSFARGLKILGGLAIAAALSGCVLYPAPGPRYGYYWHPHPHYYY